MKAIGTVSLAALVAALGVTTTATGEPSADTSAVPRLHVTGSRPLVVRGTGFGPHERVVVTALSGLGPRTAHVRANARGRFRVALHVVERGCGTAVAVHAVGAQGRRAIVRLPGGACVPPPIR